MATVASGLDLRRGRAAVKRLRNALQEAAPVLALLDEAANVPDTVARFTVPSGEELDVQGFADALALAGTSGQELEIIVLASTSREATRKGATRGQAEEDVRGVQR